MDMERQVKTGKHKTGVVTDKDLARLKALSGTTCPVTRTNETATKDSIRHFADGIGDPNPLWRDEHYASRTQYGCLIAPPHLPQCYRPWTAG